HPSEEGARRAPASGRVDQDADVDALLGPLGEGPGESAPHEGVGEAVHLDVDGTARGPDVLQHPRKDAGAVAAELRVVAEDDVVLRRDRPGPPTGLQVAFELRFPGEKAEGGAEPGLCPAPELRAAAVDVHWGSPPALLRARRSPGCYRRGRAVGGRRDWSPAGSGVLLRIIQYMPMDFTSSRSPSKPTGLTR